MPNILFTADTHFGHKNIISHCNRPFKDIDEHDEVLVRNWNAKVSKGDTVYHLGDFALCSTKRARDILASLNGKVTLIRGNHDKAVKGSYVQEFEKVCDYLEITVEEQKICLMHFPIESWNKAHYGSWHLHGHSHGSLQASPDRKRLDVGVDCWGYIPVCFEEIREEMNRRGFAKIDHHNDKRPR